MLSFKDDDDEDDSSHLVYNDDRRQQLMAQEQVIDDDLALIREREEQIRALEVENKFLLIYYKLYTFYFSFLHTLDICVML